MAKKDDSQPSRVYKASDVHKRRVGRKARTDEPASASAAAPAPAQAPSEGVVLTPDFGRRTEQQKAADDRWFAAMREDAPDESGMRSPAHPSAHPDSQPTEEIAPITDELPEEPSDSSDLEPPAPEPRAAKRRPSLAGIAAGASARKRVAIGVAVAAVVLVAVAVVLFTWNRWYRFDDRADLQGEWYVVGTTTPVAISEDAIVLTDDVVYRYEADPQDKTIRYTFGPMEGQGRYWFSDDRRYLVITDGDGYTSAGTAADDLLHEFSDLMDRAAGAGLQLPEGEGIIAFSRAPGFGALIHDRAEAVVTAAREEAARKAAEEEAARQAVAEAAEWEGYYYEEEYYEGEAPAEEPSDGEGDEGEY